MESPRQVKPDTGDNQRVLINPKGSEALYHSLHFSQGVRVGNIVWISGQVGIDDRFAIGGGIEEQTGRAFRNLARVISEAGGSLADIVELVTYHTSMADMEAFARVKDEFIPTDYPAWTAVGARELVLPGLLVEIRATAVIGGKTYGQS
jgi:enamine deaminase RidA (YjgF/YER057c/UK114 family)